MSPRSLSKNRENLSFRGYISNILILNSLNLHNNLIRIIGKEPRLSKSAYDIMRCEDPIPYALKAGQKFQFVEIAAPKTNNFINNFLMIMLKWLKETHIQRLYDMRRMRGESK